MGRVLRDIVVRTGAAAALGRVFGGAGAILMLHRVRPASWSADPGANAAPETFRALVNLLREHDYEIVAIDEALCRLAKGGPRFACLTFDDGYRDNHDILWPLIQELRAPVTIYVTTGYVDGSAPAWWLLLEVLVAAVAELVVDGTCFAAATAAEKTATYKALAARVPADRIAAPRQVQDWIAAQGLAAAELMRNLFMDWAMIERMSVDPLVTFGGHSLTHPRLSQLSEDEARAEIANSREILTRHLPAAPRHFAYPFGKARDFGPREERLLQTAGYSSGVRADGGPVHAGANLMSLARIGFGGHDSMIDLALRLTGMQTVLKAS